MIGEQEFKQRIAAFDLVEATMALEILFLKYPNQYFSQLMTGFQHLKEDYDILSDVIHNREHYIQMVNGEIPYTAKSELNDPLYQDSLENGVELIDEDDPVEDQEAKLDDLLGPKRKDIQIPDFLGGNR